MIPSLVHDRGSCQYRVRIQRKIVSILVRVESTFRVVAHDQGHDGNCLLRLRVIPCAWEDQPGCLSMSDVQHLKRIDSGVECMIGVIQSACQITQQSFLFRLNLFVSGTRRKHVFTCPVPAEKVAYSGKRKLAAGSARHLDFVPPLQKCSVVFD